jgi:hypothetical protein
MGVQPVTHSLHGAEPLPEKLLYNFKTTLDNLSNNRHVFSMT